jgi:uncharacterized Zn finger protein (UPF0148 family)
MCQSCGTYFDTGHFAPMYCNVCKQTKAIEKQQENQQRAIQEQQRQERLNAENNSRMIAAAEYERAQAIREQTRALLEQGTSDREAYDRGYKYVDYEWSNGNPANLNLYIGEDGKQSFRTHSPIYDSARLKNKFEQGLKDRIAKMHWVPSTVKENFKSAARNGGFQHCINPDIYKNFVLVSEVTFAGKTIDSKGYTSTFRWEVDLKDGTVYPKWSDLFKDPELNEEYRLGVEEGLLIVNSDEAKKERLRTLVPEIKKNQRQETWRKNKIKFIDFVFTLSCIAITFFSFTFILGFTSGWWMILSLIIPTGLWIQLREYQNEWRHFYQMIGILDK